MAPKITPLSIVGTTFGLFERANKLHFLVLTGLMLVFSLIELAIVSLIVPFVSALQGNIQIFQQIPFAKFIVATEEPLGVVRFVAIVLIVLFALKAFLDWFIHYDMCRLTQKIKQNLTLKLYKGYLNLNYIDYQKSNTNTFTKNCIVNTMHVVFYIHKASEIIRDSLLIIVLVFALFNHNILVSLSVISALGLIGLLFFKLMQAKQFRAGVSLDDANQKLQQWVNQSFLAIKEIKINHSLEYYQNHLEKSIESYSKANVTLAVLPRIPKVVLEYLVFTIIVAGALVFTLTEQSVGQFVPALVFYAVVTRRLIPLLNNLVGGHLELTGALALIEKLKHELNTTHKKMQIQIEEKSDFDQQLRVCNLDFGYHPTEKVLHQINLRINRGDYIAIAGKTGSGKSTLIELICGLLDPLTGHFLSDGVKLASTKGLQHTIGYVPQQVYLIDESIMSNITLRQESELNKSQTEWAHRLAGICQIHEFTDRMDMALASRVGEGGKKLSGGQIQRIGIARQLFKRPKILVLDEATSGLDNKIESKILESLKDNLPELTVIMVTHRIQSIQKFDQLIILENGKIAWVGPTDKAAMDRLDLIEAHIDNVDAGD